MADTSKGSGYNDLSGISARILALPTDKRLYLARQFRERGATDLATAVENSVADELAANLVSTFQKP